MVGDGVLKLLRFADGNLKQTNFQKLELQNFLTHAWMSEDRIIVGTDLGKLYLFELAELRWEYKITLDHRYSWNGSLPNLLLLFSQNVCSMLLILFKYLEILRNFQF